MYTDNLFEILLCVGWINIQHVQNELDQNLICLYKTNPYQSSLEDNEVPP